MGAYRIMPRMWFVGSGVLWENYATSPACTYSALISANLSIELTMN